MPQNPSVPLATESETNITSMVLDYSLGSDALVSSIPTLEGSLPSSGISVFGKPILHMPKMPSYLLRGEASDIHISFRPRCHGPSS